MKNITIRIAIAMLLCSAFNSYASQSNETSIASQQKFPMVVLLPKDVFNQCTSIKHNEKTFLLQLPEKILTHIFELALSTHEPIEDNIRSSLNLSGVCTRFNNMMPQLGGIIREYSYEDKFDAMEKLQNHIGNYKRNRRALSLLIHAQAPHNTDPFFPLLQTVVEHDDTEMVSLLFQYDTDANEESPSSLQPIYFDIKSKAMIQLFSDNKVNWRVPYEGRSILHVKSDILCPTQHDIELLENLLLLIPNLINTPSPSSLTPLDYAQLNQEDIQEDEKKKQKEDFITLLRKYGAKTTEELNQRIITRISLLKTTNLR
jgi:hypothetical protein